MTDKYKVLTVILDKPVRGEDAQSLIDAISIMKNVREVQGEVHSHAYAAAWSDVRFEAREIFIEFMNALYEKPYVDK